ncbi:GNAT family N-acetyltransferase [Albimonas sp. CAU 1670]|uniref:GNAT family N-acetyltransferase n=1 Tax=Albimonas sp. CAU 1670 TaxID=3032599 RepID=UPI0023D9D98E|nr:GNAT family N-acetyltransferase [Albimonas sp. CAU 1670]MDF2235846.1 GNAT family N-acetyltransferase [Albimonas sp. CAU 1670]
MGPESRGPVFETARLRLRPRGPGDLADCLALDRDPEVTRWIPGPWRDPAAHEAFVRARIEAEHGEGLGYWVVAPREAPERFLGWILLIPDGAGEIEIGWRLARAAWGRGMATEAALPVARHAFATVGLARVVADIAPGNAGSRRVAEKIGMRPRPDESPDADHLRHVLTSADLPGAGPGA